MSGSPELDIHFGKINAQFRANLAETSNIMTMEAIKMTKLLSDMTTEDYESFSRAVNPNPSGWVISESIVEITIVDGRQFSTLSLQIDYDDGTFLNPLDELQILGWHNEVIFNGKFVLDTDDNSRWDNLFKVLISACDNENERRAMQ